MTSCLAVGKATFYFCLFISFRFQFRLRFVYATGNAGGAGSCIK